MGIDSRHPEYTARREQWQRCNDCNEGEDAVKNRRTEYLPLLEGQTEKEYDAYRARALFFGAMSRTVGGLAGALVRREPVVAVPEKMKPWMDSLTNSGLSLTETIKQLAVNILLANRTGLLVDRGIEENARPYIALYDATAITNWIEEPEQRIVLMEPYYKTDPKDPYIRTVDFQYRELVLAAGVYTVNVWRMQAQPNATAGTPAKYVTEKTVVPQRRGAALDFIPFTFLTAQGVSKTIEKPPLLDMAAVNLSHYRNSADLEHGRHFTALPTPWVSGVQNAGGTPPELRIGSGTAWVLPSPQSRAGYLEFSGAGLAQLQTGMQDKETMMAALGARLLQAPRANVETAETARIHQSGETSFMVGLAVAVERGLTAALEQMREWEGISGKCSVRINRDFLDTRLSPQELTSLLQTWQQGGISQDTFLWNLKQGELLPPDVTVDEEKARVELQQGEPVNEPARLPAARQRLNVAG